MQPLRVLFSWRVISCVTGSITGNTGVKTRPPKCTSQCRRTTAQEASAALPGEAYLGASFDLGFNATVDRAAFAGGVVSHRAGFTVTYRADAVAAYAILVDQYIAHSVGTALGQALVVGVGTDGVSVTFNHGGGGRVLAQSRSLR